jgi:cytochrome P450
VIDTSGIIEYPIVRRDDLVVDEFYGELQRTGPVHIQLPYGEPCWLATSYEDVRTIYGDRRFARALGLGHDTPRNMEAKIADDPSIIANMDPPMHTRLRRLTLTAFSAKQIQKLRGSIEAKSDQLLDDMLGHGQPVDFVAQYAWDLPLSVITGILGVSPSDVTTFRGWVDSLMNILLPKEEKDAALGELLGYISNLIAERRTQGTDDLLSIMVHARDEGDQLTESELISLSLALFLAGFETTAAQLGNTVYALMAHRDRWEELVADRELQGAALEELWRWIPSFRYGMTHVGWALEDVELSHGVVIPAGEAILPEHVVANRDEAVFPHASKLDFHRDRPPGHLSLAHGAHRCLGAHLAQLEIEVTLSHLLDRFPTLELAVPSDEVKWSPSTFLRSPAELPLRW